MSDRERGREWSSGEGAVARGGRSGGRTHDVFLAGDTDHGFHCVDFDVGLGLFVAGP